MHYKVSKDGFTLQHLLNLQTYEVFQGLYSRPTLNHTFDFWLNENYFEPSWKSVPAKTEPAGPVPPPLYNRFTYCINANCSRYKNFVNMELSNNSLENIHGSIGVYCVVLMSLSHTNDFSGKVLQLPINS